MSYEEDCVFLIDGKDNHGHAFDRHLPSTKLGVKSYFRGEGATPCQEIFIEADSWQWRSAAEVLGSEIPTSNLKK